MAIATITRRDRTGKIISVTKQEVKGSIKARSWKERVASSVGKTPVKDISDYKSITATKTSGGRTRITSVEKENAGTEPTFTYKTDERTTIVPMSKAEKYYEKYVIPDIKSRQQKEIDYLTRRMQGESYEEATATKTQRQFTPSTSTIGLPESNRTGGFIEQKTAIIEKETGALAGYKSEIKPFQLKPTTKEQEKSIKEFNIKALKRPLSYRVVEATTSAEIGGESSPVTRQIRATLVAPIATFGAEGYEAGKIAFKFMYSPKEAIKEYQTQQIRKKLYYDIGKEQDVFFFSMVGSAETSFALELGVPALQQKYQQYKLNKQFPSAKGNYKWTPQYTTQRELTPYEKTLLGSKDISQQQKTEIIYRAGGKIQYGIPTQKGVQTQLYPAEFKSPSITQNVPLEFQKGAAKGSGIREYLGIYGEIPRDEFLSARKMFIDKSVQGKLTDVIITTQQKGFQVITPNELQTSFKSFEPTKKVGVIDKIFFKTINKKYPIFQSGLQSIQKPQTIAQYEDFWGKGKSLLELGKTKDIFTQTTRGVTSAIPKTFSSTALIPILSYKLYSSQVLQPLSKTQPIQSYNLAKDVQQISVPKSIYAQSTLSRQATIAVPTSRTRQVPTTFPTIPETTTGGGGGGGIEIPKDITPFKPELPEQERVKRKKKSLFKFQIPQQEFKYTPSLEAKTFKIKGKKPKFITGIEIRKINTKFKMRL